MRRPGRAGDGRSAEALDWPRLNYVVSTKFFWGLDRQGDAVNRKDTLNRKYLMQAIDGSLRRFGLDHIDLVYCHRPDPQTPVEETVRAMSDMITQGKALYWGTSEWPAADIRAAWDIADRTTCTSRWSSSRSTTSSTASASSRSTRACTTTSASA